MKNINYTKLEGVQTHVSPSGTTKILSDIFALLCSAAILDFSSFLLLIISNNFDLLEMRSSVFRISVNIFSGIFSFV